MQIAAEAVWAPFGTGAGWVAGTNAETHAAMWLPRRNVPVCATDPTTLNPHSHRNAIGSDPRMAGPAHSPGFDIK